MWEKKPLDFTIKREHCCYYYYYNYLLFVFSLPACSFAVISIHQFILRDDFQLEGGQGYEDLATFWKASLFISSHELFYVLRKSLITSKRKLFFFFWLFFTLLSWPPFARAASWQAHKMVLRLRFERRLYFCFSLPFLMALRNTCQSA